MKIAISFICFIIGCSAFAQEPISNYRTKKVVVRDSIKIDTVSINTSSFMLRRKDNTIIDSSYYSIDFSKALLTFKKPIETDSIVIDYLRYPDFMTRKYFQLDERIIVENTDNLQRLYKLNQSKIENKIEKEISKAEKRFGDAFNKEEFVSTNGRVLGYQEKIDTILKRLGQSLEKEDLADVKVLIEELEIADPLTGSRNWTDVKQFNLMFGTKLGASAEHAMDLYLRPETAQGIFVNFLNVQKTGRMKIPFGIAQTGKAFRNEIVARQFIFRMREFEQMEMQFFIKPGTQKEWFDHWKETRMKWHLSLGLGTDNYRFHDHEKLAHYADAATDIEFKFPFGFKELEGIHSRTDFDLKQHEEFSGKKLQYFDHEDNASYTPYVLETSIGLDRMFLAVFSNALQDETLEDGSVRTVLKLPAVLAPTKAAVLPLIKRDGLPEIARQIIDDLKWDFSVDYDEKDAVGRRYRRQDANGTPFCITVDHDTLEDNTVTIRHRDTMEQQRVKIEDLKDIIKKEVDVKHWLQKMK